MPKHHLDRRAGQLAHVAEAIGEGDDLLTTAQLAGWLAVSEQWCEIGRHRGYGPPYLKLAGRIRYRRSDVLAWLDERRHHATSEYRRSPTPKSGRGPPMSDRPTPRFRRGAE